LGSLIAIVGRRTVVSRAPNPFGPTAIAAAGYALLFWASVLWFGITEPDWMLSYMIPAHELPLVAVQVVFALALVLSALSGHTLTAVCLQRNRTATAALVTASGAAVWMGLWAFTLERYLQVGTHDEFAAGTAVALQESSMVGAMNAAGAVQGLAGAALLAWLYTAGKRLRAR
jgi:hypothetical protein